MKARKIVVGIALAASVFNFSGVGVNSAEAAASFTDRIQSIMNNEEQVKLAFYLDSEGYANYEQSVLDQLVQSISEKLPAYAKLHADSQFLGNLDLFREDKNNELMAKMAEENPTYAAILNQQNNTARMQGTSYSGLYGAMYGGMYGTATGGGGTAKVPLTKEIIDEFLAKTDYDGMIIVRIDPIQTKVSTNYAGALLFGGFGGTNTKVEMDVTLRVYNKQSEEGYVFSTRQRVVGKVHGQFAPDTAAKRALPQAMEKIDHIDVK